QWVGGAARVLGVVETGRSPAPEIVAGGLGSAVEGADQYGRRRKGSARRQPGTVGTRRGVEPRLAAQRPRVPLERQVGASAEFDAEVPAARGAAGFLHEHPGNHLARLTGERTGVGARGAAPAIAVAQLIEMRSGIGGDVG